MQTRNMVAAGAWLLLAGAICHAEIRIVVAHHRSEDATADFEFKTVARPAKNDAAAKAIFTIVDGRRDPNGGDLSRLQDGKVPSEEDAPSENFFFQAGTDGERLLVDLGAAIEIQQVNTYSWHPGPRGPQVYKLYAGDGQGAGFNLQPKQGTDPAACGWKLLASVDTRPAAGEPGGQYGVSISDSSGSIGLYRYLLFEMFRTEKDDAFGNTFYSEIDAVDRHGPALEFVGSETNQVARETVEAEGGKYRISIDTSETPDLTEWARAELVPLVKEWYPRLVRLLPSTDYEAPAKLSIIFSKDMGGVAGTSGARIRCSARWIRQNLKGEAKGAIFHEMVHVVQQYGRTPRAPGASRAPAWLTEGIADYVRWYHYEPASHGAEITKRNLARARFDASYRITANFLNWVSGKYGQDMVPKVNAAIREGRYRPEVWKDLTGHTAQELGEAWKAELENKLGSSSPAPAATNEARSPVIRTER